MYKNGLRLAQKLQLEAEQAECSLALEIQKKYGEGSESRLRGRYQDSLMRFEEATHLAHKMGSEYQELKCLRQLSLTHWQMNNYKEFCSLNENALKIAQKLNSRADEAKCLNNIGLYYGKIGDYSRALNYLEEALLIVKNGIPDQEEESNCLNNIGIIFHDIGSYEKSLEYLERALILDQQLKSEISIAMDLNNIGNVFMSKGISYRDERDLRKAIEYLDKSLELARKVLDKKIEIKTMNNLGVAYSCLKKNQEALEYFRLALKKAEEIQDIEDTSMIANNIGNTILILGQLKKAEVFLRKAIGLASKIGAYQTLWEAYFGLGQCYEKKEDFSGAENCYKKAIDIIDHVRSHIHWDAHKAGFVRNKFNVYEALINLLLKRSRREGSDVFDRDIFYMVEKAKSRAFLESLAEAGIDIQAHLKPEWRRRESEISKEISFIMPELSRPGISEEKREKLLKNLEREEDKYMNLISKIRAEIPEAASLVSPELCSVNRVQSQLLDQKTAIIEYFLGESQSFAFAISKNHYTVRVLPRRKDIESSLKGYLKLLSTPPDSGFKGFLAGQRLYEELFPPLDQTPGDSVENLIIVPDGVLHYLPFETLLTDAGQKDGGQSYLIKKYNISYAPSTSALLFLLKDRKKQDSLMGLLAMGSPVYSPGTFSKNKLSPISGEALRELYLNRGFEFSPLPYSKKEILNISKYFSPQKREIYLEDEAKEEVVKKKSLRDYQIIHFACHGFLDERFPFRSALVLSFDEDREEDGFLQAREIYNLRLNANLVVLSACQTGRGMLENGEGILGLSRIFFYAGAKSVLCTLWRISDKSTSVFMDKFYHRLSGGCGKAAALRQAKLEMLCSKFSHPFYWAAFILNGDYLSKPRFD